MTGVLIGERKREIEDVGEGARSGAEAEMSVRVSTQDCWDCLEPPAAKREYRNEFSRRASRRSQPCQHLDFGLLGSRAL